MPVVALVARIDSERRISLGVEAELHRNEEKLKELSARSMLQEFSEVRMVHLKAGEAEYRIRTELSPATNAIFQATEVPVPRRVSPVH